MKYRIAWRFYETGATSVGEPISETDAKAWLVKLKKEYSDTMGHWIVPAKTETEENK